MIIMHIFKYWDWLEYCLMIFIILIFGLAGYGIYSNIVAEKFELRKDSWNCTKSHEESYTTYIQVGNIQVPQIQSDTICDQWSRK